MPPTSPHGRADLQDEAVLHARVRSLEQENARLLDEQWTRLQETRALTGISRLLSERLDPDVVGGRIAESLRSLVGGGSAVVYRLDADSANLLAMAVAHGPAAPTAGWRAAREIGSGAIGLAMRERRTITSPDVLADARVDIPPALHAHMEQGPDRAILAVPLLTQDRLIGVLAVRSATGTVFDARAVQLAEALADQAAITLQHAQLFAEEERRRREAEVLADLARTIGAAPELATVLRRVTEAAQELCRSDGAVIGLRMPESDAVRLRYWTSPWYDELVAARIESGHGLGGHVLQERRPLRTSDYLRDTRFSPRYLDRIRRLGIEAQMAVPILIDDHVEGLLYVDNRSARAFTDHDESVLVRLAAQAAIAIRNAQILEAEQIARGTAERLVRALRESQDRFQFVARATNDAVWDWDLVSDAMWWNEGVSILFGYPPKQIGPDITWRYETIHPDDRERVKSDINAAVKRGAESWSAEYRYRRADGSYAHVFDRGYVLHDGDGRPTRMIGAMMDITQRLELEEELRQAQKMEAVGRLAGGVAHDFNNLLTIITGRTHLVLGRLKADDPVRRSVEVIQKTADRAAGLTRQLLAFSRKQVLQRKVLDLNTMVADVSTMLRRLIGEDVDLLLTLGPAAGRVNADRAQLEQALMNLAVNARDAMPEGGTLGLETDQVQLGAAPPDRPDALPPGPYAVRDRAPARRRDPRPQCGGRRHDLRDLPAPGRGLGRDRRRGRHRDVPTDDRSRDHPTGGGRGRRAGARPRGAGTTGLQGGGGERRGPGGPGLREGGRADRPHPHRRGDAAPERPRDGGPGAGEPARHARPLYVGLYRRRDRPTRGARREHAAARQAVHARRVDRQGPRSPRPVDSEGGFAPLPNLPPTTGCAGEARARSGAGQRVTSGSPISIQ